jgi:NADPH-dependent curcumin reductase CurA
LKQSAPNGVDVFFDNVSLIIRKKNDFVMMISIGWWRIFSRNGDETYGTTWTSWCLWFNSKL